MLSEELSERFGMIVGRRAPPEPGKPPSPEARDAMTRMANYRTAVPKGVFIYASHEEANADWERWQLDAMQLRATEQNSR